MSKKVTKILLVILYINSVSLILIGVLFNLEKLPHRFTMLIIGLILLTITSYFEKYWLKKEIKKLKELIKTN